ncbi:hypothetical protein ABRY23_12450 [Melioribacteraceae bacterium 4301-Me]|uniref:hypothetical protein n=1 Tax=Pyranulibacter aquaticus TaxID=3163344 RepID=UPI003595CF01
MRLIRENTHIYEPYLDSILRQNQVEASGINNYTVKQQTSVFNIPRKEPAYINIINYFSKRTQNASSVDGLFDIFYQILCDLIPYENASIYFIDENGRTLQPVGKSINHEEFSFLNKAYQTGTLEQIFSKNTAAGIQRYYKNKTYINYIYPIVEYKIKKGFLSVLSTSNNLLNDSKLSQVISILLDILIRKMELINYKVNFNDTYKELHLYQSKLTNDYKYSAIGELTSGVVEHIFSPLQVIVTSTDLLSMDANEDANEILKNIKEQVNKIKSLLNPLIRFVDSNNSKTNYQPCNLNEIIQNYHSVVNARLRQINYECLLDLEENIPTIISIPNDILQILTNVFTLLSSSEEKNMGGILIQTRSNNEYVVIKIITTDYLPVIYNYEENPTKDLSIIMINSLMKKYNGKMNMQTDKTNGTSITLSFPIVRKML